MDTKNQQTPHLSIGPDDILPIVCNVCGSHQFIETVVFGKPKAPTLLGLPEDAMFPIGKHAICLACKTPIGATKEDIQNALQEQAKQIEQLKKYNENNCNICEFKNSCNNEDCKNVQIYKKNSENPNLNKKPETTTNNDSNIIQINSFQKKQ